MDYVSTRGAAPILGFEAVTLAGLAADGGLYLPAHWPAFSRAAIADLAGLDYVETAVRICTPFVGDALTETELRALLTTAYAGFAHAAIAPLKQLDARHWLLELFHGPTLAFKDVAMQALGLVVRDLPRAADRASDDRRRDERRYRFGGDRRARGARQTSTSSCSIPPGGSPTSSGGR